VEVEGIGKVPRVHVGDLVRIKHRYGWLNAKVTRVGLYSFKTLVHDCCYNKKSCSHAYQYAGYRSTWKRDSPRERRKRKKLERKRQLRYRLLQQLEEEVKPVEKKEPSQPAPSSTFSSPKFEQVLNQPSPKKLKSASLRSNKILKPVSCRDKSLERQQLYEKALLRADRAAERKERQKLKEASQRETNDAELPQLEWEIIPKEIVFTTFKHLRHKVLQNATATGEGTVVKLSDQERASLTKPEHHNRKKARPSKNVGKSEQTTESTCGVESNGDSSSLENEDDAVEDYYLDPLVSAMMDQFIDTYNVSSVDQLAKFFPTTVCDDEFFFRKTRVKSGATKEPKVFFDEKDSRFVRNQRKQKDPLKTLVQNQTCYGTSFFFSGADDPGVGSTKEPESQKDGLDSLVQNRTSACSDSFFFSKLDGDVDTDGSDLFFDERNLAPESIVQYCRSYVDERSDRFDTLFFDENSLTC